MTNTIPFWLLPIGAEFLCPQFPPKPDETPMCFRKETANVARDEYGNGYDFTSIRSAECVVLLHQEAATAKPRIPNATISSGLRLCVMPSVGFLAASN